MAAGDLVFTEVSVAGAPAALFCVDPAAGDPVAAWFLDHDWIDEPVQRVFMSLIEPGARVLDLGCHLGTFSLPAAALGASVLAVDAFPAHVRLLRAAAHRNGFDDLAVVNCAITDAAHDVQFVPGSIHGHVKLDWEELAGALNVPRATVDELLEQRGWDRVDVIKMDIEGCETAALAGMSRLHASGCRPLIVFECNGGMLPLFASSVCELRERFAELGYELLFIDHLRPGILAEAGADAVQPECVCDYLAAVERPAHLSEQWTIESPLSRERTVSRVLDSAASDAAGYRRYAAEVLADGPHWLRAAPEAQSAIHALEQDLDLAVRQALDPLRELGWAVEHTVAPEPQSEGPPTDMRVWAQGIALPRPSSEPDSPHERSDLDPKQLLLSDAWLHVRAGQLVGVVSQDAGVGSALLRALAGRAVPVAGQLEVRGRRVLVGSLGEVLEGELSVADNLFILGAFLGCAPSKLERDKRRIAELAGIEDQLDAILDDLPTAAAVQLALAAVLELATPELLLVDLLPPLPDQRFRDWLTHRTWQLRGAGGAIVQAILDAGQLLGPSDRIVWIGDRQLLASGHGHSVLEARWRSQLGLRPSPGSGVVAPTGGWP